MNAPEPILVYRDYKEPLKAVEKGKGYGFYGTIAITEDGEFMQCHLCGELYASVGGHLRVHNLTATEYKEQFGLGIGTGLVSEALRKKKQDIFLDQAEKGTTKGLPVWLQEYNRKVQSGEVKHIGVKHKDGGQNLERRNREGTCPEQTLEKIRELAEKLGHTPSIEEFRKHYNYKYYKSLTFHHGSYLAAVKKLGVKSAKDLKEPTDVELIQALKAFHKRFNRTPMKSDFDRGLVSYNRQMFWRHFGSLNEARTQAGLDAVLPMPFGQSVVLTAEQYFKYKLDHTSKKTHRKNPLLSGAIVQGSF